MQNLILKKRSAVSDEEIARLFSTANGIFCLNFWKGEQKHSIFNRDSSMLTKLYSAMSDMKEYAEIVYFLPDGRAVPAVNNFATVYGGVA